MEKYYEWEHYLPLNSYMPISLHARAVHKSYHHLSSCLAENPEVLFITSGPLGFDSNSYQMANAWDSLFRKLTSYPLCTDQPCGCFGFPCQPCKTGNYILHMILDWKAHAIHNKPIITNFNSESSAIATACSQKL